MGSNPIPSAMEPECILPQRGFFDLWKRAFTNAGSFLPPLVASLLGSQDNLFSQTFWEKSVFDIMVERGVPQDLGVYGVD